MDNIDNCLGPGLQKSWKDNNSIRKFINGEELPL
jgi:hypothetical protein